MDTAGGVDSGFLGGRSDWTGGSTDNSFAIGSYQSNICFFTNNSGTERMRIDSNGDVQIHGTSMLASSILSIDGSGEARNGVASKVNNNAYYAYAGINASGTNTFLVYGDGDVENTNNSYT